MVLFAIYDLRQAVEMAKGILNKEKLDRQLEDQSSSTPFMNIWEGYNSNKKAISFDTQDRLHDKIDKLTSMMSKLSVQGSKQNRPFKPKIYHEKNRGQGCNNYHQGRHQGRYRSSSGDRYSRLSHRDRSQYGQNYIERP